MNNGENSTEQGICQICLTRFKLSDPKVRDRYRGSLPLCPWRNGPPERAVSEGVIVPRVREVVLGMVPDFIDFHILLFISQQLFHGNYDALLRGLSGGGCQTLSFVTVQ